MEILDLLRNLQKQKFNSTQLSHPLKEANEETKITYIMFNALLINANQEMSENDLAIIKQLAKEIEVEKKDLDKLLIMVKTPTEDLISKLIGDIKEDRYKHLLFIDMFLIANNEGKLSKEEKEMIEIIGSLLGFNKEKIILLNTLSQAILDKNITSIYQTISQLGEDMSIIDYFIKQIELENQLLEIENGSIEPDPGKCPDDLKVYKLGNKDYIKQKTTFGICLMGGGDKNMESLKWFVKKACGGDIVVIMSKDYEDELTNPDSITYTFWNKIGGFNSITTMILDSREKANYPFVEQVLKNAEAVWIPGGNQTEYYDLWSFTKAEEAINYLVNIKNVTIGGTSAGMHSMGKLLHTPYAGNSVLSADALNNPYLSPDKIPDSAGITFKDNFFDIPYMEDIITDTHWSERNRLGRSIVFLARIIKDGIRPLGNIKLIAADECSAICVEQNGIGQIFGEHPDYEDFVHFIKPNSLPNICTYREPLTWIDEKNGAVTAYRIPATKEGLNKFDIINWQPVESCDYTKEKLNIYRGEIEDLDQKRTDIQTPRK